MMLTPRECEVVRLFALGKTWEQVMHELGSSRATIHNQRHAAMAKYGATRMIELYRDLGWLRVP